MVPKNRKIISDCFDYTVLNIEYMDYKTPVIPCPMHTLLLYDLMLNILLQSFTFFSN